MELPKLHLAATDRWAKLDRWARFLQAQSAEEIDELAREDAIMTTAKDALQELSLDPVAQRLARERETAVLMHRHLVNSSLEQGRVEGRAEGLIMAICSICEVLKIELAPEQKQRLSSLGQEQLTELLRRLKTEQCWPDGF